MYTSFIRSALGVFAIQRACRWPGILLAIGVIVSTSSSAAISCDSNSISGLVAGSYPCFETSVEFRFKSQGPHPDTLTATYNSKTQKGGGISLFHLPSSDYSITNTVFDFSASIQHSALTGSMSISGNIDSLNASGLLLSANLTGVYGEAGNLVGFNTKDIDCSAAINAAIGGSGCTQAEVVYFLLDGTLDLNARNSQKFYGTAYTSVPLPATVWLFGSGSLGLIGIARRKKTA
jgi:PEP-CTERM motif